MQRGAEFFRQGNYEAALGEFRSAARMQPRNPQIENLIGVAETKLGRIAQANSDYRLAIQQNPSLEAPHKNLGFNLLNAGDYTHAEPELRKALALDSTDPFVHYCLVMLYLKTARDAAAIGHLKPAESLIVNDGDTAYSLALACLKANVACDELKFVGAVEQRSGFSAEQEFQLGELLSSRQRYAQSVAIFRHMAQEQPTSWMAEYNLAVSLFQAGQASDALPMLERLAQDRPADGQILSLLGNVCESVGKMPQALDAYQRAVAADPGNEDAYLDSTRLLMDLDRYDDAAALIQQGIENAQDAYALQIRMGAIDLKKGEIGHAEHTFQSAIAEHPELAIGYVALAKAYMKEGRDQAARDVLVSAHKTLPQDFALEYVLGLACAQLGDTEQAIGALRNAEQMNPAVVEPHYQLGKLYMEADDWAQAQKELERVIAIDPAHTQARYQLSRVYARLGDSEKAREMQARANELMNAQRAAALDVQKKRLSGFHPDQEQSSSDNLPKP